MANSRNLPVLYGDDIGFLSKTPVVVRAIEWLPNAAGDAVILACYPDDYTNNKVLAKRTILTHITSGYILTDEVGTASLYPSTFAAKDAIRVFETDGAKKNIGLHLIRNAGDDSHVDVADADLNNEVCNLALYTLSPYQVFNIGSQATTKKPEFRTFCNGVRLPNLAVHTIGSSGKVYVYVD